MPSLARATAVLAALSALLLIALPFGAPEPAEAAISRVYVESAVIEPGGEVEIDMVVEATAPGVGAWHMDVAYDQELIQITYCQSHVGICSPETGQGTGRFIGASQSGLAGTIVLATYTFRAIAGDGVAEIDLNINQLTDPNGQDLSVAAEDGSITIAAATPSPTPTAAPTAAPTPTPAAVPATGGPRSASAFPLLPVLAAAALSLAAAATVRRWLLSPAS